MKQWTKIFVTECLLALTTFGVAAAELADGQAAYGKADFATAVRLLRPLAEAGNAEAEFSLGDMYDKGQGVPQDFALAAKWYRKAADQGNAEAQRMLGIVYDLGRPDVRQDLAQAAFWYRKAADQGNAKAQCALAHAYEEGRGVPKDYVQAYMWYSLAASNASSDMVDQHDALDGHKRLGAQMTPAQIAEAQRRASEWKPI